MGVDDPPCAHAMESIVASPKQARSTIPYPPPSPPTLRPTENGSIFLRSPNTRTSDIGISIVDRCEISRLAVLGGRTTLVRYNGHNKPTARDRRSRSRTRHARTSNVHRCTCSWCTPWAQAILRRSPRCYRCCRPCTRSLERAVQNTSYTIIKNIKKKNQKTKKQNQRRRYSLDLHSDKALPVFEGTAVSVAHLHSYEPTVFTHVADGWHV